MAVKLSSSAYDHAKSLIASGRIVADERDGWSEHQPSAEAEDSFIAAHGWREFARWHLGVDDDHGVETKARYEFPYGNLQDVHRCAVLAAESRAAEYGHRDIELAAAHLHGMIEGRRSEHDAPHVGSAR